MASVSQQSIVVRGARENNLREVSLDIPRDHLVVVTGLSGSGKSSLAFDTIYAEGQRRYLESMSAYARQFMGVMERPDVDYIGGLSPVIAIGQKTVTRSPRSTVGTVTEVYDFLRLLFARVGRPRSQASGQTLRRQSEKEIVAAIMESGPEHLLFIMAPIVRGRKGHYREHFKRAKDQGFTRVRVDGEYRVITKGMKVARYQTHDIEVVIDRVIIHQGVEERVRQSVNTALKMGSGTVIVGKEGKKDRLFSTRLFDPATGRSFGEASPGLFSFNLPYGSCPRCKGLGISQELVDDLVIPDPSKSINQGGLALLNLKQHQWFCQLLECVLETFNCDLDTPISEFSPEALEITLRGGKGKKFNVSRLFHRDWKIEFDGLYGYARSRAEKGSAALQRRIKKFMRSYTCPHCAGSRLNDEARSYHVAEYSIGELIEMDIESLSRLMSEIELEERDKVIAAPILKEIRERLSFMLDVGVGYLSLNRGANTLSGGESQRIRLATQIGTQLTGVLYVLDEPSIGLHARDNRRLIRSLKQLRDLGNSVLVVEHDREMIERADYVVDLGPGAGEHGGIVVFAGGPEELTTRTNGEASLTVEYLSGEREIRLPEARRPPGKKKLILEGATGNNLRGTRLNLPLGLLICVTGVSGSGKSTLINHTLRRILEKELMRADSTPLPYTAIEGLKYVKKVISIDQKPIGRTPRSNPMTYTKTFTHIRDLFAGKQESLARGYTKSRFSFNVKGGRCETCGGAGVVRVEMNFLPDVFVNCDICKGKRYNRETLEIRYRGKSIADVLEMTVDEAIDYFVDVPKILRKLTTLQRVGLGYIRLGQRSTTISGGEAQRIKLSRELSRPGKGDTLYILDEPTTGLHFEDIRYLLEVLQALVDKGNTVLVIEHNMDVVKVADYIIDLGPEGGTEGGEILFSGPPEQMALQDSHTGKVMKEVLYG